MTNIVGTIVIAVVTNWSNPIIVQSDLAQVNAFQGVPARRGRMGIVVKEHRAKLDYKGEEKYVVVERETVGYVQQIGQVTKEDITWGPATPFGPVPQVEPVEEEKSKAPEEKPLEDVKSETEEKKGWFGFGK